MQSSTTPSLLFRFLHFSSVHTMANTGRYTWTIRPSFFRKFVKANVGDRYCSDTIQMARLKWILDAYPNGRTATQTGSIKIYLTLVNLPKEWEKILVQFRIKCIETESSCTDIAIYDENNDSWGWPSRILLLCDLIESTTNTANIMVHIKLIKIWSIQNEKLLFHDISPILSSNTINWTINNNLIKTFKNAYFGKQFESEINDTSIFILQCCP